jgi:hypothetical protein
MMSFQPNHNRHGERGKIALSPRSVSCWGFNTFTEGFADAADMVFVACRLNAAAEAYKIGDLQRRL